MLLWLLQQLLFLQFTQKLLFLLLLKLHLHGPLHLSATPLWQYYNWRAAKSAALLLMHAHLLLLLNYVRSELPITNCAMLINFGAKEPSKSEKEGSPVACNLLGSDVASPCINPCLSSCPILLNFPSPSL
jgi:hypothetical protein